MAVLRFTSLALFSILFATLVIGQDAGVVSESALDEQCRQCGTIFEIKAIRSEREFARTFEERAPPAGPFINIPLTRKPNAQAEIGVMGSSQMRKELQETEYEVVVRYDDDRFTLIKVRDVSNLRIGDRVRVNQNRIEPIN
ncbi:MAG: hypothetical protein JSW48_01390 [Betaproteobacteria bacterium]|jgi:hypothetical protein|nr:MAG: hypothetical protein JSW48_01390 [Betaproteobacteria bacterium]